MGTERKACVCNSGEEVWQRKGDKDGDDRAWVWIRSKEKQDNSYTQAVLKLI